MTLLTLSFGVALGGGLSQLSEDELRFRTCEQLANEQIAAGAPSGAVEVWTSCKDELHKAGFHERDAAVEGRITLAKLERDYASLKARDPAAFSRALLITVAQHPNAEFPYDAVVAAWLGAMNDPAVRQNLGNVRTVELRWDESGLDAASRAQLDAWLRRYLGDAGFKVEAANSTAASEAGVSLRVRASVTAQPAVTYQGKALLQVYATEIQCDPVRFRTLGDSVACPGARVKADDPVSAKAKEAAMERAAQAFAAEIMFTVLTRVYQNEELPPP